MSVCQSVCPFVQRLGAFSINTAFNPIDFVAKRKLLIFRF